VHTIKRIEISFDAAKDERNLAERGLSFAQAATFDFGSALFWLDTRKHYPEQRIAALGWVKGRLHSLVFTETDAGIRIISFRKANAREVKRYEQETQS
jgi:uncharacterized DUF497 family protein